MKKPMAHSKSQDGKVGHPAERGTLGKSQGQETLTETEEASHMKLRRGNKPHGTT